ncbi:MAG TPA: thioredoxin family protein [Sunxiuqinia sp.]|nr:thioredoxin family protein [Sunxiuqinia sp.]
MFKNTLFTIILIICTTTLFAKGVHIYNPNADAESAIQKAVKEAKTEGKFVFLEIGGNWCPWCVKFHHFVDDNQEIKNYVDQNFVVVNVNYSKENKNLEVLKELGFPQRFGFPVFVVLNDEGNNIHIQNSAYLEDGDGYSPQKVLTFFKQWSPAALDSKNYGK